MRLFIPSWADTYESPIVSSRPKKPMAFFFCPTAFDGIGEAMLDEHPHGDTFESIWWKLCRLTAKLPIELRGQLVRGNGQPYTIKDLFFLHRRKVPFELYEQAIHFFLAPHPGWLIDMEATAKPETTAVRRVIEMPTPKIEEPSIYETSAYHLLQLYTEAKAPLGKLMDKDIVIEALLSRLDLVASAKHPESLELIAENLAEMLDESRDLEMILRIDNFIRRGPCLAPRKDPKYQRGSLEHSALVEIEAGRMTHEEAKALGANL